jgi:hypothetical protein
MNSTAIASAAQNWMYKHGHVSHDDIDCSSFVADVLRESVAPGFKPMMADEFMHSNQFMKVEIPEPGDLVHWSGHIAIVIDPAEGTFIGSQSSTGVAKSSYKTNPYWMGRSHRTFLRFQAS